MKDPSEKKKRTPDDENSGEGFSFLDMLDLSPQMHQIMHFLVRDTAMAYAPLCEAIRALPEGERLSQGEIDNTLNEMIERGYITKDLLDGQVVYKVNIGRRKTRTNTLDKEIWDSLDWDENS